MGLLKTHAVWCTVKGPSRHYQNRHSLSMHAQRICGTTLTSSIREPQTLLRHGTMDLTYLVSVWCYENLSVPRGLDYCLLLTNIVAECSVAVTVSQGRRVGG